MLIERYRELRRAEPRLRTRDAALRLGVSEAELAAVSDGAVRLRPGCAALLEGLAAVGEVMALTRNDRAVHERTGRYDAVRVDDAQPAGGVFAHEIDLRVFPAHWRHVVAVTVPSRKGPLPSIQVFDAAGDAVHKVYATDGTALDRWLDLTRRLADPDPAPIAPLPSPGVELGPEPEAPFLDAWAGLADTHDFHAMLRAFGLTRAQALAAAEGRFTERLDAGVAAEGLLREVAASGLPIMVFVGNRGCVQIHSGPVKRIQVVDAWLNVLDDRFNLHLHGMRECTAWRVRKPTRDGDVTSLEVLDPGGELVVQLFGVRKPGQPEDPEWRAAVRAVEA